MVKTISKEEFKEMLDSGECTLIDVRTSSEHNMHKIAESAVIDVNDPDFVSKIEELDKNGKYLVYCASGVRSSHALEVMKKLGFSDVYNLEGGITNWLS